MSIQQQSIDVQYSFRKHFWTSAEKLGVPKNVLNLLILQSHFTTFCQTNFDANYLPFHNWILWKSAPRENCHSSSQFFVSYKENTTLEFKKSFSFSTLSVFDIKRKNELYWSDQKHRILSTQTVEAIYQDEFKRHKSRFYELILNLYGFSKRSNFWSQFLLIFRESFISQMDGDSSKSFT